ncbi:hypothetical protein ISS22_03090 [candidate division KSB1 bacterium]|nr:hypothetical protein [candidate division KSB1 bacterium]
MPVAGYRDPFQHRESSGTSAILLVRRLFGGFLGGYPASYQIRKRSPSVSEDKTEKSQRMSSQRIQIRAFNKPKRLSSFRV